MTDSEPKPTEPTPAEATPAQPVEPTATPPAAEVTPPTPASEPAPAAETTTPAAAQPAEAAPPAEQPVAEQPLAEEPAPPPPATGTYWGTGRRKSAVARVRILQGEGKVLVNKREVSVYFPHLRDQLDVVAPLELAGVRRHWDVVVNVRGGGTSGQAGAIRLGLARAIVKVYNQHEPMLRNAGYLTRDARRVERKKPGRRKARRRFQFSKR